MKILAEGMGNFGYFTDDDEHSKFIQGVEKDLRNPKYHLYCNMYIHNSYVANIQVYCNRKKAKCGN